MPLVSEAMVLQIEQKKLSVQGSRPGGLSRVAFGSLQVRKALPATALQTDGDHRPWRRRSAQAQARGKRLLERVDPKEEAMTIKTIKSGRLR